MNETIHTAGKGCAIETRVLERLANEEWVLDEFRVKGGKQAIQIAYHLAAEHLTSLIQAESVCQL